MLLDAGDNTRLDVVVFVLGLEDLDEVGHNLLCCAGTDFSALHDLDLNAENALA